MNLNELFSCVLYIGFLLYFILGKLDRERMSTGAVYDWHRFFHALFLFRSPGLGGKMEVRTTWDEVTKTPGADRKGEGFTSISTSTK